MGENTESYSRRVEETIAKIIDAAHLLLMTKGEQELSITDVCRTAGVSRPTLYRYFPTLPELIERVFLKVRDDFDEGLRQAIEQTPDVEKRLEVVVDYMVEHLVGGISQIHYKANPEFTNELIGRFFECRTSLYLEAFNPVFDLWEQLRGYPANRYLAAEAISYYYISLNLRAVKDELKNPKQALMQIVRSLISMPRLPAL